MKVLEKTLKILFDILIIIMLLLMVIMAFNFFQLKILNYQYPNFFGYSFLEVSTGSMSGTIEINDVILLKLTKDVKKGDIITFIKDNDIITHRIVEITQENIITKGDANNNNDKPIKKEDVIGKVIKTFPNLGIWIKVFTDSKVKVSVIITIFLLGAAIFSKSEDTKKDKQKSFSEFMRKRRERKNDKKKEKKKV